MIEPPSRNDRGKDERMSAWVIQPVNYGELVGRAVCEEEAALKELRRKAEETGVVSEDHGSLWVVLVAPWSTSRSSSTHLPIDVLLSCLHHMC